MIDWYFVGIASSLVSAACSLVVAIVALVMLRRNAHELHTLSLSVAALQAQQTTYLTGRSLGPLHEKINAVAQDVSGINAQMKATNEQLRTITTHILKP